MGSYRKLSLEQAGFQKGRGISEQILLGNELINWLDRGFRPNNAVIKLDMAKAFDCIDWQFLRAILLRFGFSAFFVSLVLNHLEDSRRNLLRFKRFLTSYEQVSGQNVNWHRSAVLFSS